MAKFFQSETVAIRKPIQSVEEHQGYCKARELLQQISARSDQLDSQIDVLKDSIKLNDRSALERAQAILAGTDVNDNTPAKIAKLIRERTTLLEAIPLAEKALSEARREAESAVIEARRPQLFALMRKANEVADKFVAAIDAIEKFDDENQGLGVERFEYARRAVMAKTAVRQWQQTDADVLQVK